MYRVASSSYELEMIIHVTIKTSKTAISFLLPPPTHTDDSATRQEAEM